MSGRVKFTDSFLNQSYNILERLENLNENDVWIHELRLAALLGLTRTTEHGLHTLLQVLLAELKSTKRKIAGEKVIKINQDLPTPLYRLMPQETFSKGTNTQEIIRTKAKWYQFGAGMLHGCDKQSALKQDLVSINFGNIYRDDAVILWEKDTGYRAFITDAFLTAGEPYPFLTEGITLPIANFMEKKWSRRQHETLLQQCHLKMIDYAIFSGIIELPAFVKSCPLRDV